LGRTKTAGLLLDNDAMLGKVFESTNFFSIDNTPKSPSRIRRDETKGDFKYKKLR
jgi:hypothetical protein